MGFRRDQFVDGRQAVGDFLLFVGTRTRHREFLDHRNVAARHLDPLGTAHDVIDEEVTSEYCGQVVSADRLGRANNEHVIRCTAMNIRPPDLSKIRANIRHKDVIGSETGNR